MRNCGLRITYYAFLAIVLLGLPACAPAPNCSRMNVLCAGLVTDTGGINDHGLNQEAWDGLQDALADGTVQHAEYVETVDPRDYEKNIAYFARGGYDVVITIGMGQRRETLEAADLYPHFVFVGLDQIHQETRPNLYAIVFPEDQMGFLAGVMAAMLTKTRLVGAVCDASSIDSQWRYCEGFRKGVMYSDEEINVLVLHREDQSSQKLFADPDWGQGAAQDLIHRGADVIFGAGGGTGQGALLAAAEAGVYAIGAEQDQWYALTEARPLLVTSVYGAGRPIIRERMRLIRMGSAQEAQAVGPIMLAPFHDLDSRISDEMRSNLAGILQALQNGELGTGVPLQAP